MPLTRLAIWLLASVKANEIAVVKTSKSTRIIHKSSVKDLTQRREGAKRSRSLNLRPAGPAASSAPGVQCPAVGTPVVHRFGKPVGEPKGAPQDCDHHHNVEQE